MDEATGDHRFQLWDRVIAHEPHELEIHNEPGEVVEVDHNDPTAPYKVRIDEGNCAWFAETELSHEGPGEFNPGDKVFIPEDAKASYGSVVPTIAGRVVTLATRDEGVTSKDAAVYLPGHEGDDSMTVSVLPEWLRKPEEARSESEAKLQGRINDLKDRLAALGVDQEDGSRTMTFNIPHSEGLRELYYGTTESTDPPGEWKPLWTISEDGLPIDNAAKPISEDGLRVDKGELAVADGNSRESTRPFVPPVIELTGGDLINLMDYGALTAEDVRTLLSL